MFQSLKETCAIQRRGEICRVLQATENSSGAGSTNFCFVMPFHFSEGRGGGAEVQAWFLARDLAHRGYRVRYVAQSVSRNEGKSEIREGVTIRWLRYRKYFRWLNSRAYYDALCDANPDIVVQRTTSHLTGVAAFWARLHKRRFIWICTDNHSPLRWAFLRRQLAANRRGRVGFLKSLTFLSNALIVDLMRDWGMRRLSQAFTQNDHQRYLLKQSFGLDSERMLSGHPLPEHTDPPSERLNNGIVLWASNLGPNKRPEQFIEMARFATSSQFRFIMIGGRDDPQYIKWLFADIPGNFEWLGRLSHEETLSWFRRAAFFVNTSEHQREGFPNTFIEAWMRGVLVISLEVNPNALLTREKLGFITGDPQNAVETMIQLSRDVPRYCELADRAIKYARTRHSISSMTENFLSTALQGNQ